MALIKYVVPVLFVASCFAQSAHAGSVDEVIKSGVLRACTPGDYKPFSFAKPDGGYEGIDVDLMQTLAASLGVKVEYVKTTWANLMADFTANKCDIAQQCQHQQARYEAHGDKGGQHQSVVAPTLRLASTPPQVQSDLQT